MNTRNTKFARMAGVTLVELLVAMVIGLFLLAGIVTVMVGSKQKFLLEQELSYIQENARFVVDELSREIRMAGYFGCNTQAELTNSVNTSHTANGWAYRARGIFGVKQGGTLPTGIPTDLVANSDVIIINRAEPEDAVSIANHVANSATITLTEPPSFSSGQIVVVATPNCDKVAIFQTTGPSSSANTTLNHNTGNANPSPGNCHKALSGGYTCDSAPAPSVTGDIYPNGSSIMQFTSSAFYLRESPITGQPAVFKRSLGVVSGSAGSTEIELVSGVEEMTVVYGVDTTATDPDGFVNRYLTATQITEDEATAVTGWVGWDRVMAARVTLILRSTRPVFNENTEVDLGEGYTYNDRFLRQKVTSTVRIRNRGI